MKLSWKLDIGERLCLWLYLVTMAVMMGLFMLFTAAQAGVTDPQYGTAVKWAVYGLIVLATVSMLLQPAIDLFRGIISYTKKKVNA